MSIATSPEDPGRRRPKPPALCRLTMRLAGADYTVKPLDCPAGRGWRLTKVGSDVRYNLTPGDLGPSCTCDDFVYRSGRTAAQCKHLRAAYALGLLRRPGPDAI